jgi:hypothetical protein
MAYSFLECTEPRNCAHAPVVKARRPWSTCVLVAVELFPCVVQPTIYSAHGAVSFRLRSDQFRRGPVGPRTDRHHIYMPSAYGFLSIRLVGCGSHASLRSTSANPRVRRRWRSDPGLCGGLWRLAWLEYPPITSCTEQLGRLTGSSPGRVPGGQSPPHGPS